LCGGDEIDVEDIQLRATHEDEAGHGVASSGSATSAAWNGASSNSSGGQDGAPLGTQLEEIERDAIVKALEQTRYNKTAAAHVLGISFRALRYRIKKLGIE
jgi:two-component system response regulator PilR (NtrC family)